MQSTDRPAMSANRWRRGAVGVTLLLLLVSGVACSSNRSEADAERQAMADEMEGVLQEHVLDLWYPRVMDEEHGGFLSDFNHQWTPDGPQDKFIVSQARHTWTTARAARFYPDADSQYLPIAAHGFAFLRDVMWDDTYGGFVERVSRDGVVQANADGERVKRAYGNAFAIYGLASYYAASGNDEALQLAQEAFRWLDAHAHDPVHGGYFQFMARDGTPFRDGYEGTPPKDQNSSIHLLEAFTELYHVWPDPVLEERLREMLHVIRDTLVADKGYLTLFTRADWTPISYRDSSEAVREANYRLDHVSFGHDVETAFLMLEAAEALGAERDTTLRVGKAMVDHALRNGWDEETGGLYDGGYYPRKNAPIDIVRTSKAWWAQAEALNAFLLMADLFPDDEMRYFEHFRQQWTYVQDYLLDDTHGGWYRGGIDEEPDQRMASKGGIWKAAYHETRSLMQCIQRLRMDAQERATIAHALSQIENV
jgi:mannobiose 2-epimerase